MSRVAIFVDGQNFHKNWESEADGYPFEMPWLMDWVVEQAGGTELFGVNYYSGDVPDTGVHRFLNKIEQLNGFFVQRFLLKTMEAKCPLCKKTYQYAREKEVDTTMVADIVRMAATDAYDIAIVMSGDADMTPALDAARMFGKRTWVATWKNGLSPRLKQAAYGYIDLMDAIDVVKEQRQKELDDQRVCDEVIQKLEEMTAEKPVVEEPEPVIELEPDPVIEDDGEEQMPALEDLEDPKPEPVEFLVQLEVQFTLDELHMMSEIQTALTRIPFMGVGYFLNNWEFSHNVLDNRTERVHVMESLIEKGILMKTDREDGHGKILVFKVKPPENMEQTIAKKMAARSPIGTFAEVARVTTENGGDLKGV